MRRGVLLLVLLLAPLVATAAGDGQETKQTVAMSQPVFEGLKKAQEQIEAKQYGAAQAELKKLRETSDLSPYETAQIWNLTAYGFYLQENYKQAIGAYLNVLKQDGLPAALEQSTLKTLSQLYFTVEDYAKALTVVDRLTDKSVTVINSHSHYDHVGGNHQFERILSVIGR